MRQADLKKELERQRGQLVGLLESLDEKNLAKQAWNNDLERRRRYYSPKNNGLGRHAFKRRNFSAEDEKRRTKYLAEIRLLDDVMTAEWSSQEDVCRHLELLGMTEHEFTASPQERAGILCWETKRTRLLAQFSPYKRTQETKDKTPREWREKYVREWLKLRMDVQQNKVAALKRMPVRTLGEQDLEDGARAQLALYERLWTSNHLYTAEHFFLVAEAIRLDVSLVQGIHDHTVYKQVWGAAMDSLIAELRKRFCSNESAVPLKPLHAVTQK